MVVHETVHVKLKKKEKKVKNGKWKLNKTKMTTKQRTAKKTPEIIETE